MSARGPASKRFVWYVKGGASVKPAADTVGCSVQTVRNGVPK